MPSSPRIVGSSPALRDPITLMLLLQINRPKVSYWRTKKCRLKYKISTVIDYCTGIFARTRSLEVLDKSWIICLCASSEFSSSSVLLTNNKNINFLLGVKHITNLVQLQLVAFSL